MQQIMGQTGKTNVELIQFLELRLREFCRPEGKHTPDATPEERTNGPLVMPTRMEFMDIVVSAVTDHIAMSFAEITNAVKSKVEATSI